MEVFFRHKNMVLAGLIVLLVAFLVGASFFRITKNKTAIERDIQTKKMYLGVTPDEIVAGDADARIVVLEYTDFDCPFCKIYYEREEKMFVKRYANDSVAFARRHMPVVYLHPHALIKAQLLECAIAQEPERYEDATAFLYKNPFTNEDTYFALFVQALNLQNGELRTCLTDGSSDATVAKDMAKGAIQGVSATPTFIIFKDKVERARVVGNRLPQLDASIRLLLTEK